jgi:hypothetical protein
VTKRWSVASRSVAVGTPIVAKVRGAARTPLATRSARPLASVEPESRQQGGEDRVSLQ